MFKVQEEDLPGDALSVFNLKDDFEFIQNVRATTAARKREAGPPLEAELAAASYTGSCPRDSAAARVHAVRQKPEGH